MAFVHHLIILLSVEFSFFFFFLIGGSTVFLKVQLSSGWRKGG